MTTRRLAAILAADVVGYSRLIGADEAGTLSKLSALHREIIHPLVAENSGRVFKTIGDGLLAEFPSTVQALRCAIVVQERVRSGELQLRIGVHQGDVVVEGNDLLGDGVNVAARLEGLAEPGGICISGRVREDAVGKLSLEVEDLGEPDLKNITQRHRVFRLRLDGTPERQPLPLPDKPSIAVRPFANISGDPEQEYFADGMVEEIITGLSRVRSFFVIARNSSFAYKGKSPDVRRVGRELGVRYVLEGSVRKAGNRVRITGQLVDAATGAHLWADRFDGTLEDVFEMQDRITANVVSAIEPNIRFAEIERAERKTPQSLQVYDLVLRALPLHSSYSREGHERALALLRQATDIDPKHALAAIWMALCHFMPWQQGWIEARRPLDEIVRSTNVALEYGSEDPDVLARAAYMVSLPGGDMHGGLALIEKALALNPNSGHTLTIAGQMYAYACDTDRAMDYLERAARLNPLGWQPVNFAAALGHFVAGRYEEAADHSGRASSGSGYLNPSNIVVLVRLRAASLGLLGRVQEGRQAVERLLTISPRMTIALTRTYYDIDLNHLFKTPGVVEAMCEGLRRAGLPE
jgi:adenylate cyclase